MNLWHNFPKCPTNGWAAAEVIIIGWVFIFNLPTPLRSSIPPTTIRPQLKSHGFVPLAKKPRMVPPWLILFVPSEIEFEFLELKITVAFWLRWRIMDVRKVSWHLRTRHWWCDTWGPDIWGPGYLRTQTRNLKGHFWGFENLIHSKNQNEWLNGLNGVFYAKNICDDGIFHLLIFWFGWSSNVNCRVRVLMCWVVRVLKCGSWSVVIPRRIIVG